MKAGTVDRMRVARVVFAGVGVALIGFGVLRFVTQIEPATLLQLGIWMVAAIVLHDLVIAPATLGIAALLRRVLPAGVRRWVQFWLIASALVSVIAVPLVILQGSQPAEKALLIGPYAPGWALLLGLLAVVAGLGWAVDRWRLRARQVEPGQTDPAGLR